MSTIINRRCTHPEYGVGRATAWTLEFGRVLVFVVWDDCRHHGVAGGWYRPCALTFPAPGTVA